MGNPLGGLERGAAAEDLAQPRCRRLALQRLAPYRLGNALVGGDRFVRAGDHGDPVWLVGRPSARKALTASVRPIAGAYDTELTGRSTIEEQAELKSHRLGIHHVGDVADLDGGACWVFSRSTGESAAPADQAGVEEGADRGFGDDGDNAGSPLLVRPLACGQQRKDLLGGRFGGGTIGLDQIRRGQERLGQTESNESVVVRKQIEP